MSGRLEGHRLYLNDCTFEEETDNERGSGR
jgi:hypothetical protein